MTKHKFIGIILVLLSLMFVCMSAALPVDAWNFNSSPRTLPLLASSVMLVFSVAHLLLPSLSADALLLHRRAALRVLFLLAAILLYILLIEKFGYIASTFALTAASAMIIGIHGYTRILCLSLSLSVGTWLLFTKAFSAYLPNGTFFG